MALRLAAALLAERKQPAEPGVGGAIGRINEHRHAVGQVQTASYDKADASCFRGLVGANDTGERIAVDDRQRLDAELPLARTTPRRKMHRAES